MTEQIRGVYRLRCTGDPHAAADSVAVELSTGSFLALPGESDVAPHRATVDHLTVLPAGDGDGDAVTELEVEIAVPAENLGNDLGQIVATFMGNVFELRSVDSLRLLALHLPDEPRFGAGPVVGTTGTRALLDVDDRPLFGTIVKPSVGLSPETTAAHCAQLAEARIDFIKDDELISDPAYSTVAARARAVLGSLRAAQDRTGQPVMYACNISATGDQLLRNADAVEREGGTCVMVNALAVGLGSLVTLRQHTDLAIHAHRCGWGLLGRSTSFGVAAPVIIALLRRAGADHVHVGGMQSKFWEADASVASSIRACLDDDAGGLAPALPAISSGQWGGQLPGTRDAAAGPDFLYLAGAAVFGHPGGPAAGVRSLHQAWSATEAGIPISEGARGAPELAETLALVGAAPSPGAPGPPPRPGER